MRPTIGRVVIYRSRTGNYDVPAIICATSETLHRPGVEAGYVPDLTSGEHVHLVVLTPGIPGTGKAAEEAEFLVRSANPVMPSSGGTYQEWDIPPWSPPEDGEQPAADWVPAPGTWRWPERVTS